MRNTISTAVAVSALALLLAAGAETARAETPGWYVGLGGGASWASDVGTKDDPFLPPGKTQGNFDTGWGVIGKGGYSWGMFQAEGEVGYRNQGLHSVDVPAFGGSFPASGKVGVLSVMGNGIFNILPHSRWTPYIGAGAGAAQVSFDNMAINGAPGGANNSDVVFAYQGIAGVSYYLTPAVSLAVDYRYFATTEGSFHDEFGGTFKSTYHSHNAFFNVVYHFGAPAAPPPPVAEPAPAPMPAAAPAPAPAPTARTFIVFFDFDKYNLTPDGRRVVEEAASAYKAGGSAKVTLAGYTDLSGSVPYNLKLSERRAKTVAAYMGRQGVPESAMDVSWHGKENPRVPTPDGVREPQNRRVEIGE